MTTRTEAVIAAARAVAERHKNAIRGLSDMPDCLDCALADTLAALDRETNPPGGDEVCECGDPLSRHFKTTSGETACGGDGIGCGCRLFRPSPPAAPRPADLIEAKNGRVHEEGRSRPAVAVRSPASPECRHESAVYVGMDRSHRRCFGCGALWLDDGQGWRRASSKGAR